MAQKYRHGIDEGPQISLDTHNTLIRRIEASKYDFKEKVKNHPYVALLIHIRAMWFRALKMFLLLLHDVAINVVKTTLTVVVMFSLPCNIWAFLERSP